MKSLTRKLINLKIRENQTIIRALKIRENNFIKKQAKK